MTLAYWKSMREEPENFRKRAVMRGHQPFQIMASSSGSLGH